VWTHAPVVDVHVSRVHATLSLQFTGVPGLHPPGVHTSVPLQRFASGHRSVPRWHAPPAHTSPSVHERVSSHGRVLSRCVQPLAPHASSVHGLPSSQPAVTQLPAQHVCAPVQLVSRTHVVPMHRAV